MSILNTSGVRTSESGFRGAQFTQDMSLGLWQKKQFRAYREFSTTQILQLVTSKNILLTYQSLFLTVGACRAVIAVGGTPGGTFTPITTKFCKYTVDGAVAGNTVIGAGGTLSGATEREVLLGSSGTSGVSVGLGNSVGGARVLAAGTYYITLTITGTTSGMYALEWEELD